MTTALERIKQAASMQPVRKVVLMPDGSEFEFWMRPITLAERARAKKEAGDDDQRFALTLLVQKARDEHGEAMFHAGQVAEMKNDLPAAVLDAFTLAMISESGLTEAEWKAMKSGAERGSAAAGRTAAGRKAEPDVG